MRGEVGKESPKKEMELDVFYDVTNYIQTERHYITHYFLQIWDLLMTRSEPVLSKTLSKVVFFIRIEI